MTLDQQIADEAARIRAFKWALPILHAKDCGCGQCSKLRDDYAEALAAHLVNNRSSSFVNAQLLEATQDAAAHGLAHLYLCKARERSRISALGIKTMEDVFGHNHFDCSCQMQEHNEALKAAIANADKVAS